MQPAKPCAACCKQGTGAHWAHQLHALSETCSWSPAVVVRLLQFVDIWTPSKAPDVLLGRFRTRTGQVLHACCCQHIASSRHAPLCLNQLYASLWEVDAEDAALQLPYTLSVNCSWERLQFSAHSRSLCSGTMSIRRLMRSVPAPSCKVIEARSSMSWAKRCSSSPCRSCCCLYLQCSHTVHAGRVSGQCLYRCLILQGRWAACACSTARQCVS